MTKREGNYRGREREIVKRTRELLRAFGAKVIKTSGEGEPDLVGSYMGVGFAIECKQREKTPNALQLRRIKEWERSGAVAFWTDFPAKAMVELEERVNLKLRSQLNPTDLATKYLRQYENKDGRYWVALSSEDPDTKGFDLVAFFNDYKLGRFQ